MNNEKTAATMAQEFDNTNAGNTEITARIVFTGNEYAENPDAVKLEITEQVRKEIQQAKQFMLMALHGNFTCVEVDIYAEPLQRDYEDSGSEHDWDENHDWIGNYTEHDFVARGQCLRVSKYGGIYYYAYNKYDDTAIIKTDDLSKLIFPTADKA